jgi:hypothetical protein
MIQYMRNLHEKVGAIDARTTPMKQDLEDEAHSTSLSLH